MLALVTTDALFVRSTLDPVISHDMKVGYPNRESDGKKEGYKRAIS